MALFNEINRLQDKVNKLSPKINPPVLEMNFIKAGDEVPEPSPWSLTVYIESKEETLGL